MLAQNKGHIVTIASMAGKMPCNGLVDYCSSKYAAVGFHETLQEELRVGKTHDFFIYLNDYSVNYRY